MTVYFRYKPITNYRQMGARRKSEDIKFIVAHYTANYSATATANNHYIYLNNATRLGSAHYYIDKYNIIQTIPDHVTAWAVGDNQGYGTALNGCTNYNSISVEICVNEGYNSQVIFNAQEMIKELLRKYPKARVCRHWDVTRKNCPAGFTGNNNPRWLSFLEEIKKNRRMIIPNNATGGVCKLVGDNKPQEENNNNNNNMFEGIIRTEKGGYSVMVDVGANDVLNVRLKPDINSKIVSSYRDKSKIYVHEVLKSKTMTWYKIEYKKGLYGFVSAKYCREIK